MVSNVLELGNHFLIRWPTQTLNHPPFKPGSTSVSIDFSLLGCLSESRLTASDGGHHGGGAQLVVLASLSCPRVSLFLSLFAGGCGSCTSLATLAVFSVAIALSFSLFHSISLFLSLMWFTGNGGRKESRRRNAHFRDFLGRRRGFGTF